METAYSFKAGGLRQTLTWNWGNGVRLNDCRRPILWLTLFFGYTPFSGYDRSRFRRRYVFYNLYPLPVMKIIRLIILGLSFVMGTWVIASFAGVMVNAGDADFWTTSLMWSLLASVLVMPALVVAHHATKNAEKRAAQKQMEQAAQSEEAPFVDEREEQRAAWPIEKETKKDQSSSSRS